jgi:hypothetical protein
MIPPKTRRLSLSSNFFSPFLKFYRKNGEIEDLDFNRLKIGSEYLCLMTQDQAYLFRNEDSAALELQKILGPPDHFNITSVKFINSASIDLIDHVHRIEIFGNTKPFLPVNLYSPHLYYSTYHAMTYLLKTPISTKCECHSSIDKFMDEKFVKRVLET